uniref:Uncharacterized protein n=1 Tax=Zea mays TaxID=4577 RepID=C0HEL4_MAIZE|nr:unknown [Zea mays]
MMRAGSVVVGSSNRSVAPAAEVVVVVVVEALAGGGGDLGVDVGGEPRVLRRAQPLPLPLPLAALIARRNAALQELHQAGGAVVLVQVRRPPAVVVVREAGQLEGRGGGGGEGAEVAVVVRGGGGGFWRRRGRRLVQELALQRVGEAGHVCRRRGGGAGAGAGHVHQRREVGDGRYVARLGVGRRLRAAPLACGWCCCCSCTTYDEALLEHPAQHPLVLHSTPAERIQIRRRRVIYVSARESCTMHMRMPVQFNQPWSRRPWGRRRRLRLGRGRGRGRGAWRGGGTRA